MMHKYVWSDAINFFHYYQHDDDDTRENWELFSLIFSFFLYIILRQLDDSTPLLQPLYHFPCYFQNQSVIMGPGKCHGLCGVEVVEWKREWDKARKLEKSCQFKLRSFKAHIPGLCSRIPFFVCTYWPVVKHSIALPNCKKGFLWNQ